VQRRCACASVLLPLEVRVESRELMLLELLRLQNFTNESLKQRLLNDGAETACS